MNTSTNKNDYINQFASYHASLCPEHEHARFRGSVLAAAHFCQQSGMPLEEAKARLKLVIEKRRTLE